MKKQAFELLFKTFFPHYEQGAGKISLKIALHSEDFEKWFNKFGTKINGMYIIPFEMRHELDEALIRFFGINEHEIKIKKSK